MKEKAYLDYIKSFSLNAFDTIVKLEEQFDNQLKKSIDQFSFFRQVKILTRCFEVQLYQIKDTFEFVQIPEFGNCILKIFNKIMSVLKLLLIRLTKIMVKQESNKMVSQQNQVELKQYTKNDKLEFKAKEQIRYLIKEHQRQQKKEQQQQRIKFQANKNQEIYFVELVNNKDKALKMQNSQSQSIIVQTLNHLSRKSDNALSFLDARRLCLDNNLKDSQNLIEGYNSIQNLFLEDSKKKVTLLKRKWQKLFQVFEFKKNCMRDKQTQVDIQQSQSINNPNRNIQKRYQVELAKLRNDIQFQKDKNLKLQNLYCKKNLEFHQQITKIKYDNLYLKQKSQKQLAIQKDQYKKRIIEQASLRQNNQSHISLNITGINEQQQGFKIKSGLRKRPFAPNQTKEKKHVVLLQANHKEINQLTLNLGEVIFRYVPQANRESSDIQTIDKFQKLLVSSYCQTITEKKSVNKKSMKIQNIFEVFLNPILEQKLFNNERQKERRLTQQTKRDTLINFQKIQSINERQIQKRNFSKKLLIRTSRINQLWKVHLKSQQQNFNIQLFKQNSVLKQIQQPVNNHSIQKSRKQSVPLSSTKNIQRPKYENVNKISFCEKDILGLFFNLQNAQNYESLNYNSNSRSYRVIQSASKIKESSQKKYTFQVQQQNLMKQLDEQQVWKMMFIFLFKQLKSLKKHNLKLYENIRNFIRYPYSSIKMKSDENWIKYSKEELDLQYEEIVKIFNRIFSIHLKCSKKQNFFCFHIYGFFKKIGIRFD